ncbi:nodulation protein NoeA [Spirochaetia bacterium]|nr:nodulation protein NoeA [Spirochaetia bacterium]
MTIAATESQREFSSFRDPSGVIFEQDGIVYRKINPVYMNQYGHLMTSGLYEALVAARLLIPHETVNQEKEDEILIHPEQVPFISYPYEWCFEQYRDAALATLRIQLLAMQFGMTLKDASAYNIQFINGQALLIDTLSFEMYDEGPWAAYGQFCRHFFAPLMLMLHIDPRMGKMMQDYIDGIPLDLTDHLLRGKGGFAAWQHIHLHALAVKQYGREGKKEEKPIQLSLKKALLVSMIDSLIRSIENLKQKKQITEWGDYYSDTNYTDDSVKQKESIVTEYLKKTAPVSLVWDFGANDGRYSRCAVNLGAYVIAFDIDPVAVSRNYLANRKTKDKMLPLLLDLTCPSPAIGFANRERKTIARRKKPDVILMLAVIHHLAISNNLPLEMIAAWLASLSKYLIIEFVPKEDSQVKILLKTRIDIFPDYHETGFESAFGKYFQLCDKTPIQQSKRTLYLLKTKLALS